MLRKQKARETLYGTWGTVIYDADEGIFKAWYGGNGRPTGNERPRFQKDRHVLCYATSTDGVVWNRPELGLHAVVLACHEWQEKPGTVEHVREEPDGVHHFRPRGLH